MDLGHFVRPYVGYRIFFSAPEARIPRGTDKEGTRMYVSFSKFDMRLNNVSFPFGSLTALNGEIRDNHF